MLVLKNFFQCDYRGIVEHVRDNPKLLATLELSELPHFTTLQKAAQRLLKKSQVRRLLDETVRRHLGRKRRVDTTAVDSTGLECTCASGYFVRRRERVGKPWKKIVYHHFPKLSLVSTTATHFVLEAQVGRGPRPDVDTFRAMLSGALRRVRITRILGDAGYDSEGNHSFARDHHDVLTVIPAKHGRPTTKPPSGRYRRLMRKRFNKPAYGQRSQVETVVSMIKRRQGAFVRAKSFWSQMRDLYLKALTHNFMILWTYRFSTEPLRNPLDTPCESGRSACILSSKRTGLARQFVVVSSWFSLSNVNPRLR
jgi:transposase